MSNENNELHNIPGGSNGQPGGENLDHLNAEGMEALTLEELDEFMKRAKARATNFREADVIALRHTPQGEAFDEVIVDLDGEQVATLVQNFFPELPDLSPPRRLVQGIIFDFDNTLAQLRRPIEELMREGAITAEQYMRSTGMEDLPDPFWESIVEARIFAQTKSDDEQEEHISDDALSFLLQFFGYPASKMDPDVLRRTVDLFYAPEMSAWRAMPGAIEVLKQLSDEGYKIAIIANYSCDRTFQRIVDYTGLRPYLDFCLCSASVEWRKPGRDIYDIVLKRWDVEPYELVCVGDSLKHDIAGGLDLGAQTVHCRMIPLAEDQRIVDTVQPDAVIDDLRQLPALVHAWS
jgi:FMN phosphatase YigB (HAD superfamily)